MDQHRATVVDPITPRADVSSRRRIPMSTVDVQHVDFMVDHIERRIGKFPYMTHSVCNTRCSKIGREQPVVIGGLVLEAVDL